MLLDAVIFWETVVHDTVVHGIARCFRVLNGVTMMWHNVTGCYMVLYDVV